MKNRNNAQGTKFLPHAMRMGLRKMTRLSAVDCQSPGRNGETEAQWNKEYQKVRRKQVVLETQWPQWITIFPTVIETICSLHTQLLTNSSLYIFKIPKQAISPSWLMLRCFSSSAPHYGFPAGANAASVGVTGWAKPLKLTAASSGSLSPHPTMFPWASAKSSTTVSYHSPGQVAVRTKN